MISFENFRCPHCGAEIRLNEKGKSLVCDGLGKKHCYDLSSSGYVNFAPPSQSGSGDSKEAVRSRTSFLESGGYAKVCAAITDTVNKYCCGGLVVDAGCGEGYYTNNIAKGYNGEVVGFDLSKHGVEYASKSAHRQGIMNSFFAVGSVFSIPIADSSADGVVNIFAPCVESEYSRILKKSGVLITAGAGENHLLGLKKAIYDTTYKNTEREDMPKGMSLVEEITVAYMLSLEEKILISALFSMTPYYYRTSDADLKKLSELERLDTEVDVKIKIFRKN